MPPGSRSAKMLADLRGCLPEALPSSRRARAEPEEQEVEAATVHVRKARKVAEKARAIRSAHAAKRSRKEGPKSAQELMDTLTAIGTVANITEEEREARKRSALEGFKAYVAADTLRSINDDAASDDEEEPDPGEMQRFLALKSYVDERLGVAESKGTAGEILPLLGLKLLPHPFEIRNLALGLEPRLWPIWWEQSGVGVEHLRGEFNTRSEHSKLRKHFEQEVKIGLSDVARRLEPDHRDMIRIVQLSGLFVQLCRLWLQSDSQIGAIAFLDLYDELFCAAREHAESLFIAYAARAGLGADDIAVGQMIDPAKTPAFLGDSVEYAKKRAMYRGGAKTTGRVRDDKSTAAPTFDAMKHLVVTDKKGKAWLHIKNDNGTAGRRIGPKK